MDVDSESEMIKNGHILGTRGSYLSVLDSQKNIAPIMDAVLVDIEGTGQVCSLSLSLHILNYVDKMHLATNHDMLRRQKFRVVKYSPTWRRFRRTGIRSRIFKQYKCLGSQKHVSRCVSRLAWPVQSHLNFQVSEDSHILVSTLQSTSLFKINDVNGTLSLSYVEGDALSGLRVDVPTLAFANVARRVKVGNAPAKYENSSLVVQVTARGVFLLELDPVIGSHVEVNRWIPEGQGTFGERQRDIVAASVNPSQVVIALHGGKLIVLSIAEKDELRVMS